ncbi:hypothetical protein U9M48_017678, partial [Paspalum notatum var. saurae]
VSPQGHWSPLAASREFKEKEAECALPTPPHLLFKPITFPSLRCVSLFLFAENPNSGSPEAPNPLLPTTQQQETPMRFQKRSDGGGYDGGAAALDVAGLGAFARLSLSDHPPDELGLAAAYDDASGSITVSLGDCTVSASPADLAVALQLPLRPVTLAAEEVEAEAEAAAFFSADAIAAVREFVCDRVLLGCGEDGAAVEVAAALQLVEQGKAYKVGWGELVWAVVKGEVMAGTPRRYAPFLLRLMESQRPELFAQVDGRLPLQKRLKGQELQQCQWTGGMLFNSGYLELGEQGDASLACRGSQNIGDLEDMPIFGEGHMIAIEDEDNDNANAEVALDVPLIGNAPLATVPYVPELQEIGGIGNYQALSPFQACMQKIRGHMTAMDSAYLIKEKVCRDAQDEVKHIKQMVMRKEAIIEATVHYIQAELKVRSAAMRLLKADMDLLRRSVQQYDKMLKRSFSEFDKYMSDVRMGAEGVPGGQNCAQGQQMYHYCVQRIGCIEQMWSSKCSKLVDKIEEMETSMASLSHEVQRLKDSRSIPDLNNGKLESCCLAFFYTLLGSSVQGVREGN